MSLIISVFTYSGIVLASDSRLTFKSIIGGSMEPICTAHFTDTTNKTFLCNSRIGLSECGVAEADNRPLAGYIEHFTATRVNEESNVQDVCRELISYFSKFKYKPDTEFLVSGYDKGAAQPTVKAVYLRNGRIEDINTEQPGAAWKGEEYVLCKLLLPTYKKAPDGQYIQLTRNAIRYDRFTLQDAIDFARFAIDITIRTMALENTAKTVGGPIDILAITPTGARWIAKKELHA